MKTTLKKLTAKITLKWFLIISAATSLAAVIRLPEGAVTAIASQLDNMAAALVAIPAIIFSVRVSIIAEMAKRLREINYWRTAQRHGKSEMHSVKSLNKTLTIINVTSLLTIIMSIGVRAMVFQGPNKTLPNNLDELQLLAVRISIALIVFNIACILWVVWKIHENVNSYLDTFNKNPADPERTSEIEQKPCCCKNCCNHPHESPSKK